MNPSKSASKKSKKSNVVHVLVVISHMWSLTLFRCKSRHPVERALSSWGERGLFRCEPSPRCLLHSRDEFLKSPAERWCVRLKIGPPWAPNELFTSTLSGSHEPGVFFKTRFLKMMQWSLRLRGKLFIPFIHCFAFRRSFWLQQFTCKQDWNYLLIGIPKKTRLRILTAMLKLNLQSQQNDLNNS